MVGAFVTIRRLVNRLRGADIDQPMRDIRYIFLLNPLSFRISGNTQLVPIRGGNKRHRSVPPRMERVL